MFQYDATKSRANKRKHGIDFEEAQRLWRDPDLVAVPARTEDEPRHLIIAMLEAKHWAAVVTYRGNTIRLISVRRARAEEIAIYESERI